MFQTRECVMPERQLYARRSDAVRAARKHCKQVFGKSYDAYEGPDYEIHPASEAETLEVIEKFPQTWWLGYGGPAYYKLRGPVKEKVDGLSAEG
jgi:hypothetical protein